MTVLEKYAIYNDLLKKWSKSLNLIAHSTISDIEERHFKDSEQLLQLIQEDAKLIDLGSGAGFPGMILAINGVDTTLVESDEKKCVFLETVSRETKTHATILCNRIEKVSTNTPFDIITARGLASLAKLIDLSPNLATPNKTRGLFLKGSSLNKEIEELSTTQKKKLKLHDSKTHPESKIAEYFF